MVKTKREAAYQKFKDTDPSWTAEVYPICQCDKWNIYAVRTDPITGEKKFGQLLASYVRRGEAERVSRDLNYRRDRRLAAAYP